MKIGIDCRLWDETGVGRYVRNIVYQLAQTAEDTEFVLFMLPKNATQLQLPQNFKIVPVDIRWHSVKEQLLLPILFLKEKLDLLHVPYFNVPVLYPKRFVVTIHDLTLLRVNTGRATTRAYPVYLFWRLAFRFVILNAIKRAAHVFTVSQFVKQDIISTYHVKADKITITPNAVDQKFMPVPQSLAVDIVKKYGIHTPYIFYLGNAHPHKNLERLVAAFGVISQKHPQINLIMGGRKDFFYRRLESETASLPYAGKIKFIGFVEDVDLPAIYSLAEAFVNPSMYEGFGIQLLEAFACGCPVVCSNTTSLPEVGEGVAYYFDPTDVVSMQNQISLAIVDSNTNKKIQGLELVKKYSWQRSAEVIRHVYKLCE